MSTTTYPTQLVLPGQVAAPEGPVDMKMMYLMHHAFRRDLNKFAAAVAATPADDVDTWRALGGRWELFFEVLHKHHSGEDAGVWPFLLERADAEERATLEAMEEEHSHIDPLLTACAEGFATLAGDRQGIDAEDVRRALKVRIEATRDALARHLAHEETDAIAILQRYMTNEDWERLEQEHFRERTPLKQLFGAVPWVVDGLPATTRDQLFAELGGPFKLIWVLARRSYRRQQDRALKYVS
ncbi:MAG: hemerythrin domain-containing protein [Nocardioidaceae bacterium]|nr:hemerythrin domain-containing protein [Nocardioidaceae bacterium]